MVLRRILYAALLLFVLCCDGVLLGMVVVDHDRAWAEGLERAEVSGHLLVDHAGRALEAGDFQLKRLADRVAAWDLTDAEVGLSIFNTLRDDVRSSPHVGSAWALDANGVQRVSNWTFPPEDKAFAYRDYFRAHLGSEVGLSVDAQQTGVVHNKPRFTLSRAVRHADGSLKAVVVAGVFSEYFTKIFAEGVFGEGVEMVMLNRSGAVLANWPLGGETVRLSAAGRADGDLTRETWDDGEERLIVRRDITGFPVRMVISVPVERVLAEWRREVALAVAFAVPANLAFIVLVVMARRGLAREESYCRRLESNNRELEQGVRERTRALDAALERERTANRAKDLFLATVSHDLRQPLQAMSLLASVVSGTAKDDATRRLADQVSASLTYGQRLLGDLVDLAQLESGVARIVIEDVALDHLVEAVADSAQDAAAAQGVTLRLHVCPVVVRSDPYRLRQILQNLVSNAIKHTPSGGRVLIGCNRRSGAVRVGVWDTGAGIPADKLDVIFEQFYQLGNEARNSANGVGLGLAIVRRTADLLGHDIDVRSRVGHGSMFAVVLPAVRVAERVGVPV